ncbi:hypothetical protein [Anditalea andensis]|uniref:Lipocalin-like domain-containing protein n=1 Tax=Anditalea andensis TaxID=1048983 RepID=A0A074KUF5_9BACT|nr:hypothetical protein [Anditalea andensis]KEO71910.1 hypothetical protein EL17_20555 [Anditalea andensis]
MKNNCIAAFLILILIAGACSGKEDDEPVNADPLIGLWQLIGISQGNQTVDVTDQACLNNSNLDVSSSTMTLTLSVPQEQGNTGCQTQASSVNWVNEDGTYYMVENGNKVPAIFSLKANNELHVDITLNNEPATLIFTK